MDFSNARVLDYSRTSKNFDSDFRFGADTSYSVEGYFLDLENSIGVSGIIQAQEFFRTGLQDYQDIYLNGENFGKGRVTNFSVNESNFVRYTTYTVDIAGFESGNLYNLSGDYYDGLNTLTGQIQASRLLEDFSENFSFNRADDTYSYTHSVDIKYASGDNILISPIDRAKLLATYILTGSNPSFGFIDNQTSGLYTGNFKEYFTESYDAINNVVSISKNFNSFNPSGAYGITLRHSYDRDEQGITNVSENGSIKVHEIPKKTALNSAFSTEISNSFIRCSGVAAAYDGFIQAERNIRSQPVSLSKNINNFLGEGSYTISYTNDPAFQNDYTWRYTHQIDKDGTFFNVSENGDIEGLGSNSNTKYANALSAYTGISTGVLFRTSGFYENATNLSNRIYLISKTENKNQFNGTIGYSQEFTDNPTYSESGLKKLEISVEDSLPVDMVNNFDILGYKELIQSVGTTTLGQRNLTFNMFGLRESSLSDILTIANSRCNDYIPDGIDPFLADAKYTYNKNDNIVNVNLIWNFNRESRGTEAL